MRYKYTSMVLAAACAFALPAWAARPYAAPDDSWVTVSGTVTNPRADAFTLDYGRGRILVEMDDWDWYKEGYNLVAGDQVIVNGRIDDDLFEKRSIEAGSVYVKGLNTFFHANASDEESAVYTTTFLSSIPLDLGDTRATGEVVSIDGRTMMVDTGAARVKVDTSKLGYDPMDDDGYQRIEVGDRVTVSGDMTPQFFSPRRELTAEALITLQKDPSKRMQSTIAADDMGQW